MARDPDRPAPPGPPGSTPDDPLASRRARLLVLAGLATIAVLGCLLLAYDVNNQGTWGCRSVAVDDARATGPTAQAAVDGYLATGAAPKGGWAASEPNRWSRNADGVQMVLDLNQSDARTYTVVRFDTCGPGIAPS